MYKKVGLLSLVFTSIITSAPRDCFQPYQVNLINQSGGIAMVKKAKNIAGIAGGQELENNSSATMMIKKRGATLEVMAGEEDKKTEREITFFGKEPGIFAAYVTINPKGVATSGFSTKDQSYNVRLVNQSGGTVQVFQECKGKVTSINRIGEGQSVNIAVRPGMFIDVQSGPENRKINYRLTFGDRTGDKPTINFVKRSFLNRGIQATDINVQTGRVGRIAKFSDISRRAQLRTSKALLKQQQKQSHLAKPVAKTRPAPRPRCAGGVCRFK